MKSKFSLLILAITLSVNSFGQEAEQKQNDKSAIYWLYDAHYRMAIQYNDFTEAKSALYNLILLEPQNDSIRYNLAYIYFDASQYPSTILACKDILTLNPNHLGALELSGISFENLGLKDKALPNYEKIYMLSNSLNSLYKMAFLQYDLKKYAECGVNIDILLENKELGNAMVVFADENNTSKEYPMEVAVLNLKGLVNKEIGNIDIAKQSFEAALAISPDFVLAKSNLAELE
jgi:tetratricopeptide (TPR) repeat protein